MGKRKCSDCGTVFSDSKSSCPKCYSESYEELSNNDYVQSKEALPKIDVKVRCSNCGNVFSKSKSVCPKCFARNEEATTVHSTSQSTSYTSSAKPSRGFVIAMIALGTVFVFIFAAAFSGKSASKKDNTVKTTATTTTTKTTTTSRATKATAPNPPGILGTATTTTTKATEAAPKTTTTTVQSNESVPQDIITLEEAENRLKKLDSSVHFNLSYVGTKSNATDEGLSMKTYKYFNGSYGLSIFYDPNNNKVDSMVFQKGFLISELQGQTVKMTAYVLLYAPLCIIDESIIDLNSLSKAVGKFIHFRSEYLRQLGDYIALPTHTLDDLPLYLDDGTKLECYDLIWINSL